MNRENRLENQFRLCKDCIHEEKQYQEEPCNLCFKDVYHWKKGFTPWRQ